MRNWPKHVVVHHWLKDLYFFLHKTMTHLDIHEQLMDGVNTISVFLHNLFLYLLNLESTILGLTLSRTETETNNNIYNIKPKPLPDRCQISREIILSWPVKSQNVVMCFLPYAPTLRRNDLAAIFVKASLLCERVQYNSLMAGVWRAEWRTW